VPSVARPGGGGRLSYAGMLSRQRSIAGSGSAPLAALSAGSSHAPERQAGVGPLVLEWEDLAERTRVDPFRMPGWIVAWHEAFGRGTLEPLTVRRGQELVGMLPMVRHGSRLSSPTNWHTPVFGAVSASVSELEQLAEALFSDRPHAVLLSFVDRADPLRDAVLHAANRARYRTLESTVLRSPYLPLEGDWESCWNGLGSKRRNTLKRRRRRLEERGRVTLRIVEGGDELSPLLGEALRTEAMGWKGRRGSAIISRPETETFYRRVAAWASERGTMRLALLLVDERLAAFDFALETASSHYLLKTGFDPELRTGAPGLILRAMMIERAYSLGLERYEFLGGEDEYKRDWTADVHERIRVQAFRPSIRGLGAWSAHRYGRPAVRWGLQRLRR
jgi:CelD/BcsL family acetyltransferase involved in cellulose biosynthesis